VIPRSMGETWKLQPRGPVRSADFRSGRKRRPMEGASGEGGLPFYAW